MDNKEFEQTLVLIKPGCIEELINRPMCCRNYPNFTRVCVLRVPRSSM